MVTLLDVLRVVHVVNAILMAWPFYALVATNQRARLGPPLGDRADTLVENVIKNRTIPCFVFQATALVTGLALIRLRGLGFNVLLVNPALGLKFALLLLIAALLAYVSLGLQPQIDALFAKAAGSPVPSELVHEISGLRARRKRMASICFFCVITMAILGVQAWAPFPFWLNAVLLLALLLFTMRAYRSVTPFGWA